MSRRIRSTTLLAVVAAMATFLAAAGPASARPSAQAGSATMQVVATGLNNPRHLSFGPDGNLYVAEAGAGGPTCKTLPGEGQQCFGTTGAITRVYPGAKQQIAGGLPSVAGPDGTGAAGPSGVSTFDGNLFATVQNFGGTELRTMFGPKAAAFGRVVNIAGATGRWTLGADIAAFEVAHNPDARDPGSSIDSDPYNLVAVGGRRIVVDAAANDLLRVDGSGISLLGIFHARMVTDPSSGTKIPMQAVPTSVAVGPDGHLYVSQLTGYPFPVGGSRVYRMTANGPTVYASGFTHVVDLTFDNAGNLYVLQINSGPGLDPSTPGELIKVTPNGTRTVVASTGLVFPGGVAIRGNAAYVTNLSVCPAAGGGPCPTGGQVVRIPLG